MSYNPPPHYSFGQPEQQPQPPQSVPPSYSPQPPSQPQQPTGYVPQQPGAGYPAPQQPTYGTQVLPTPPPAPRRSPLVPVLAVTMVIGLAGAALSLALWLRSSGDLEDAESRLDDRDAAIAQLEEDLGAAEAEADENAALAADAESMRACLDDLKAYYASPIDSEEEAAAELALQESCADWVF
jgi:hypothetical protein